MPEAVSFISVRVHGDKELCTKLAQKFFVTSLAGVSAGSASSSASSTSRVASVGELSTAAARGGGSQGWVENLLARWSARWVANSGLDGSDPAGLVATTTVRWIFEDEEHGPAKPNGDALGVGILLVSEMGSRFYGSKVASLKKNSALASKKNDAAAFAIFEEALADLEKSILVREIRSGTLNFRKLT